MDEETLHIQRLIDRDGVPDPVYTYSHRRGANNTKLIVRHLQTAEHTVRKKSLYVEDQTVDDLIQVMQAWLIDNKDKLFLAPISHGEDWSHRVGVKDLDEEETRWFTVRLQNYTTNEILRTMKYALMGEP